LSTLDSIAVSPRVEGVGVLTVTVAEADLLLSAALVAVTVKLPAPAGAVYKPEAESLPPFELQFTLVLVLPVTVAVNSRVPPGANIALIGAMLIETDGGGTVTTTLAEADFMLSTVLVAVTENVPAANPAVYNPFGVIDPPVAPQETALLATPLIIAVN
jgi:hypothetical protein